ncbi:transmembrane protein 238-like [Corythoichthys intestinalis]|uniref:transmembrane protein 238-like n=1 Tax=Corythoichthys intestinalis TaxID=161448 RepID=UPI0025A55650|nr:transmembrane protein 238-like [Corythoichthys intestinalis]XP_061807298.1 transmembrane protein 238-like [Nerophis lumbriciformis]
MSTSVQVETAAAERRYGGVGRCKCSFWFAVAHDVLGVLIVTAGVFGGLAVHDLFIYAGGIVIFLSLIWWVFWYSGNIDVPPEELEDDVGLVKLKNKGARRASDRLSGGIRNTLRKNPATGAPNRHSVSLFTIYDDVVASSSSSKKKLTRETLSI